MDKVSEYSDSKPVETMVPSLPSCRSSPTDCCYRPPPLPPHPDEPPSRYVFTSQILVNLVTAPRIVQWGIRKKACSGTFGLRIRTKRGYNELECENVTIAVVKLLLVTESGEEMGRGREVGVVWIG
ncbi:hypothetical protein Tco_0077154 [Tanacetum coccineum]